MINPLKVLLFLAGGTAVAGAGAYMSGALDPFLNPPPQPAAVASLPTDAATPPAAGGEAAPKEDRVEAAAKPADDQPAPEAEQKPAANQPAATTEQKPVDDQKPKDTQIAAVDPQAPVTDTAPAATQPAATEPQPAPAAASTIPTFDLVRVEADGSVVIAGKAAPNASVELLTGGVVIGAATAGAGGDFVVVLDKPLAPGDYQITIRATEAGGPVVASMQTAIVSVPKESTGQVLAMIEEPGKPSEIITVPQPVAAAAEPAPKPEEAGSTEAAKPADEVAAAETKPADQPIASDPAKPEATPPAAAAQPGQTVTGTEVAAADPKPEQPAVSAEPSMPAMDVAVEAVEIDGRKIFVAGRAGAGSTVRVYANELMLGQTKTSPAGRFLVEAEHDLPVGSYVVRADVMAPDGVQVLARAAVPFEREPGENIAAVAAPAAGAAQAEPKPVETQKPAVTETQPSSAEQPANGETAAPPAVAEAQPPAAGEEKPAGGGTTLPPAEAQPAATQQPAAPAATAEAQPPVVAEPSQPSASAEAPAATEQPAAPAEQKPAEVASAAPPAEVTAPALQSVNSAVIIRRGDTLWRISKRVYGRGTRYSTIYLANQDQIRDPDMIWPGQVFGVPDKSQEGETADMTKMGEQATTKAQ